MFDPDWNQADEEFNSFSADKQLEFDVDFLDGLGAGIEEGFMTGPTMAISHYGQSQMGKKSMTAQQANEAYSLTDTPVAFTEGDGMISEHHAKLVQRRYVQRTLNEAKMEQLSLEGGAGGTAGFVGGLIGGALDPVNLATGIGTSMAINKLGHITGKEVLKRVAAGSTFKHVFAKELTENFVSSVATDAVLVPFGEDAINQKIPIQQRAFNVIGSTILGGAIGVGMATPALRRARIAADNNAKQLGGKSAEVIEASQVKAVQDLERGVTPNPDHVYEMADMEHYTTRPNQMPYAEVEVTPQTLDRPLYIGRDAESGNMDIISDRGDGVLVLTDNYNLAHNRISTLDGAKSGEVYSFKLNSKMKIMTNVEWGDTKRSIRKKIKELYTQHGEVQGNIDGRLNTAIEAAESVDEFKDMLHQDVFADYKGLPDLNDWVNRALRDEGFDGYHFRQTAATNTEFVHNGIAIFQPERMDAGYKGKPSMRRGFSTQGEGVVNSAMFDDGIHFNRKMFQGFEAVETTKLDYQDPKVNEWAQPFADKQLGEMARVDDVTQRQGYDGDAARELETGEEPQYENFDPTENVIDNPEAQALIDRDGARAELKAAGENLNNPKKMDSLMDKVWEICRGKK